MPFLLKMLRAMSVFPVQPGVNKDITWDASGRLTGVMDYQIKLVADDLFAVDIQTIVDQVDSNSLRGNLEFITENDIEAPAQSILAAVKDSIEQAFIAANLLIPYLEEVPYGNYTGQNIIGRAEGTTQAGTTFILLMRILIR